MRRVSTAGAPPPLPPLDQHPDVDDHLHSSIPRRPMSAHGPPTPQTLAALQRNIPAYLRASDTSARSTPSPNGVGVSAAGAAASVSGAGRPLARSSSITSISNNSVQHRAELLMQNFYAKCAAIITNARSSSPPSASSGPQPASRPPNKWFNLEMDRSEVVRSQVQFWQNVMLTNTASSSASTHALPPRTPATPSTDPFNRHVAADISSASINDTVLATSTFNPPDMIIEVFLDCSYIEDLLVLDDEILVDGEVWNPTTKPVIRAVYPLGYSRASTSGSGPTERKRSILLESWRLTLTPSDSLLDSNSTELAVVYKKSVVFFRALYELALLLPAHRLGSRLRREQSAYAAGDPDSGFTEGLKIGFRFGTEPTRLAHEIQLDESLISNEPIPTMRSHAFRPVDSPYGQFQLTVLYRARCLVRGAAPHATASGIPTALPIARPSVSTAADVWQHPRTRRRSGESELSGPAGLDMDENFFTPTMAAESRVRQLLAHSAEDSLLTGLPTDKTLSSSERPYTGDISTIRAAPGHFGTVGYSMPREHVTLPRSTAQIRPPLAQYDELGLGATAAVPINSAGRSRRSITYHPLAGAGSVGTSSSSVGGLGEMSPSEAFAMAEVRPSRSRTRHGQDSLGSRHSFRAALNDAGSIASSASSTGGFMRHSSRGGTNAPPFARGGGSVSSITSETLRRGLAARVGSVSSTRSGDSVGRLGISPLGSTPPPFATTRFSPGDIVPPRQTTYGSPVIGGNVLARPRAFTSPQRTSIAAGAQDEHYSIPTQSLAAHPGYSPQARQSILGLSPLTRTNSAGATPGGFLGSAASVVSPQDIIPPRQSPALAGTSLSKRHSSGSFGNYAGAGLNVSQPGSAGSSLRHRAGSLRRSRGNATDFISEAGESSRERPPRAIPDLQGFEEFERLLQCQEGGSGFATSSASPQFGSRSGLSALSDSVDELRRFRQLKDEHGQLVHSYQVQAMPDSSSQSETGRSRSSRNTGSGSGGNNSSTASGIAYGAGRSQRGDTDIVDALEHRFPPNAYSTALILASNSRDVSASPDSNIARLRAERRVSFGNVTPMPALLVGPRDVALPAFAARLDTLSMSPKNQSSYLSASPRSRLSQAFMLRDVQTPPPPPPSGTVGSVTLEDSSVLGRHQAPLSGIQESDQSQKTSVRLHRRRRSRESQLSLDDRATEDSLMFDLSFGELNAAHRNDVETTREASLRVGTVLEEDNVAAGGARSASIPIRRGCPYDHRLPAQPWP